MNSQVDQYLLEGCGRCERFNTPDCSAIIWNEPLKILRSFLLESELKEERKWGSPTYTLNGKNVIMLGAFRDNCTISFLKGALLTDPQNLLEKPGKNSRSARVVRIKSVDDAAQNANAIKTLIAEAVANEKAGKEVAKPKIIKADVPEELAKFFEEMPHLEKAFFALTPGRQRSWIIYIGGAKQAKTRIARIEKSLDKILTGKGFHDR